MKGNDLGKKKWVGLGRLMMRIVARLMTEGFGRAVIPARA